MTQTAAVTTADVLISFQTRPGIEDDSIINAGDIQLVGSKSPIKPQGKGYYGLKLNPDTSAELKVFGTKYKVTYKSKAELETDKEKFLITSWKDLGDVKKTHGIQRRMQILGYYKGKVDSKKGSGTKHGLLGFQADNKLRMDGDSGVKTRKKIKNVIDNKNKSGTTYIIRKTLIRFARAPRKSKPKAKTAWPVSTAPEPDDRGFIKAKSMGYDIHGPVVTIRENKKFRLKVIRENIDDSAVLIASSNDDSIVKPLNPNLPNQKYIILEMQSKKSVNKKEMATISVKWKSGGNQIEIGSINIIVLSKLTRKVQPYFVSIKGPAGTAITPAGTPEGSANAGNIATLAQYKKDCRRVFGIARSIWRQFGLNFWFLPPKKKIVTLTNPGEITNVRADFNTILNANDTAGNASKDTVINLFIVRTIKDYIGFAWPPCYVNWPNGIGLTKNAAGNLAAGNDLAHEIGHFLTLSVLKGAKKYIHADDVPDVNHKKKDIWSARKLMYAFNPHLIGYNSGYGYKRRGCLVTVRNLSQDPVDKECHNARSYAKTSKFYKIN